MVASVPRILAIDALIEDARATALAALVGLIVLALVAAHTGAVRIAHAAPPSQARSAAGIWFKA